MFRRLSRLTTVLALAGLCAASSGCYERVVRAEGIGSNTVDTYEPNSRDKPDVLDDIMWGKEQKPKK